MSQHLLALIQYPIKSLSGLLLQSCEATPIGLSNDRRWMLVEENGQFVSQRRDPKLACLSLRQKGQGWQVSHPDHGEIWVPSRIESSRHLNVTIWGDEVDGVYDPQIGDAFFSEFLNRPIRFVYHDRADSRPVSSPNTDEDHFVGFADGFPYLILSQASIDACSELSEATVDWRRFRPNLILSSHTPFAEDSWSEIRIAEAQFSLVKPCPRCVMINVNPETGEKDMSLLSLLKKTRKQKKGIMVGQNALCIRPGLLSVGDKVYV